MSDYYTPSSRPGFEEAKVSYDGGFPSQPQQNNYQPPSQQSYGQPAQQPNSYQSPQNQSYSQGQTPQYSSNGNNYQSGNSGSGYGGGNSHNGYGGGNRGGFNKGGFGPKKLSQQELEALVLPKAVAVSGNKGMPEQFMPILMRMCGLLKQHGFVIRTGWSEGTEQMLAKAMHDCELYTPWKLKEGPQNVFSSWASDESKEFAKRFCPEWGTLKDHMQAVYSKNARLVLGKKVNSPCQLTIIWSEDGVEGNSTRTPRSGHAGHIASMSRAMSIPVININNPDAEQRLIKFLEG